MCNTAPAAPAHKSCTNGTAAANCHGPTQHSMRQQCGSQVMRACACPMPPSSPAHDPRDFFADGCLLLLGVLRAPGAVGEVVGADVQHNCLGLQAGRRSMCYSWLKWWRIRRSWPQHYRPQGSQLVSPVCRPRCCAEFAVLCCAVLCCAVLCCAALRCAAPTWLTRGIWPFCRRHSRWADSSMDIPITPGR